MDVTIGELSSTVRVTDSQALLDPKVVERLVKIVRESLRAAEEREERSREEKQLRPAVSVRKGDFWS